mmetsp:Transcript_6415/g.22565  ORF Transcript_6415/g.22565 Transcript_6415/m.22565 type:complete len:438 (-) Transcript_6415:15-1328(-)
MVGWKSTCGTFPMNQKCLELSVHHVLFELCNVVRHIIHDVHVQIIRRRVEHLCECLPAEEGHGGPVDPCVVSCACHGIQVILALLRLDACTGKLTIVCNDVVPGHGPFHAGQGIGGHLMPQSSASTVDHNADLTFPFDAHFPGSVGVKDFLHGLYLRIVVSRPQGAHLWQSSLFGPGADFGRIGVQHPAILFTVFLVFCPRVPFPQGPIHAHFQCRFQVGGRSWYDSLGSNAHRDVIKQRLCQLFLYGFQIFEVQIGAEEPHPAIDVESHTTRRDYARWIGGVKRRHIANGKSIAAVHVWQGDGFSHHTRQGCHVGQLLHRRQEASSVVPTLAVRSQFVEQQRLELLVGVERPRHAHVGHESHVHTEPGVIHTFQELHLLLQGAHTFRPAPHRTTQRHTTHVSPHPGRRHVPPWIRPLACARPQSTAPHHETSTCSS